MEGHVYLVVGEMGDQQRRGRLFTARRCCAEGRQARRAGLGCAPTCAAGPQGTGTEMETGGGGKGAAGHIVTSLE